LGSYVTYAQIQKYTGTSLSQTDVDQMIDDSEDELDEYLGMMGCSSSTTSPLLKAAVRALVMASMVERGVLDGGHMRMVDKNAFREDVTPEYLRNRARSLMDTYISVYSSAGDDADFSVTTVREDHKMSTYNLDQRQIKEFHDLADDTGNQDTDFQDTE
jgi:hypothetical protein